MGILEVAIGYSEELSAVIVAVKHNSRTSTRNAVESAIDASK
jgi:hypothetical protein